MKKTQDLERSDKIIVGISALCALLLFAWLLYDIAFLNPLLEGQIKIGKIYEVQNRVKRKFNKSLIWYAADRDETVYENDWIFTGSQSIAKIKLDSGGEIVIEPDSLIVLSRKNGVLQLNLQHGRLLADVKKEDIKINVVRDGQIETVDTKKGPISISQKDDVSTIDELTLDKDDDGEADLSLSDLADQRNYEAKEGYSDLNEHGLSYKEDNNFTGKLHKGEKAKVELKWIDPKDKWVEYEVEVATDPEMNDTIVSYKGKKPTYEFHTAQPGMYHWRIRGLDGAGNPSDWTGPLNMDVNINYKEKAPPIRLAREKFLYELNSEELGQVSADQSYQPKEEKPINLAWEKNEEATQYHVEISDKSDFSNIIGEKLVKENSLDLDSIKLGETYFRVTPETAQGVAIAEPAKGKVMTYLPPPDEKSLKTVNKDSHQILKWDNVPYAQAYEVTYKESKDSDKEIKKIVKNNRLVVNNSTGFLQWRVRVVDPVTKRHMSSNSVTVDWYDAAKRLASLHGSGQAGDLYPKITNPEPRKTFISINSSPLFIVMNWTYGKNAPAYEVEISKKPDMSQLVYKRTVKSKKRAVVNQKFKPGIYFFRVRALAKDITQETWSEVEVFRVINRKAN